MLNWIRGGVLYIANGAGASSESMDVTYIFFLFCIGLLAWLNHNLSHYYETRSVSHLTPFFDQFILNLYDKIRGKIVNRYLILGTLVLFFIGYFKYRKRVYY